ncbi:DnaT-like ssDNA-binding protein [Azospirillum sp. SYSU D00513]|uniref:DnaT-like ssDNA-binding protein n=1 Tax=Azospirillum sp. SYSU D00513 TaxID=2812561 RepID=UPI001A97786D|nr:DnaT-like ssDNA-binding protein [Azospirillum sp. SYSU D00513]
MLTVGTNAYLDAATADAYFADQLRADGWTKASAEDRDRALIMATAALDRLSFAGMIVKTEQRLAWPRANVRDGERRSLPANIVPDAIRRAVCEWALTLLTAAPSSGPAISSRSVGDLRVDYRPTTADGVPPTVRAILSPFLRSGGHDADLIA